MSTEWNFDTEAIQTSLEGAVGKAGDLVSAAEDKIQEITDAKSSMEDAQSDLEEAISTLGELSNILEKYDDAVIDLENVEIYY